MYLLVVIKGVPNHPFLNNMLTWVEERNVNFVAVFIYGFFAYYMLWACMKGNIKFGIRFFCITFYPMLYSPMSSIRPNETFINSFLVNMLLFNLWSLALTHFCTIAFGEYTRLTDANYIFALSELMIPLPLTP